jgi:hypothetical protein
VKNSRNALAIFVGLTTALAGWMIFTAGLPIGSPGTIAIWFLACLAGEALWIRTPTRRGIISMALTIDIAALFTLTPPASLSVIMMTTLLAGLFPHRRPWYKVVFNAAQSTLATAAALAILRMMDRGPDASGVLDPGMTWVPLFAAGLTFYAVNSGLVSCIIAISTGATIWRSWRDNYGYGFELWCTLAQISLAGFVLAASDQIGAVAVLALLPVLGVLWWSSARESDLRSRNHPSDSKEREERLRLAS